MGVSIIVQITPYLQTHSIKHNKRYNCCINTHAMTTALINHYFRVPPYKIAMCMVRGYNRGIRLFYSCHLKSATSTCASVYNLHWILKLHFLKNTGRSNPQDTLHQFFLQQITVPLLWNEAIIMPVLHWIKHKNHLNRLAPRRATPNNMA